MCHVISTGPLDAAALESALLLEGGADGVNGAAVPPPIGAVVGGGHGIVGGGGGDAGGADGPACRWWKALLEFTTGQRTLPLPPGHAVVVFAHLLIVLWLSALLLSFMLGCILALAFCKSLLRLA